MVLLAMCWRCGAVAALTKIRKVTAAAQRDARQVASVETCSAARGRLVEELGGECQRGGSVGVEGGSGGRTLQTVERRAVSIDSRGIGGEM